MGQVIRLEMNNWLYDAGLVGLYNIFKEAEDQVIINDNYIEFDSDLLEDFETKYFNYFINKYECLLSWYKITSYKNAIVYHEESDFTEFDESSLDNLNRYIKDVKYYIKSNSYKSAYNLIDKDIYILNLSKKLSTINIKKKQDIKDIIPKVKESFNVLKDIIEFLNMNSSKKYIAAKNVIYTIIKNAWDGVCFLNPRTKEKDMYVDYKNYFISPTKEYISIDKSKFKYNCFVCDREMKDFKNDLSFLTNTGFDTSRKSSHVWNFNNDVTTCPICKLIYSCSPAGIIYVHNSGIYINDNSSMESAITINNKVKSEILKGHEITHSLTYRALVNSIKDQFTDSSKYELSDVQVVRYSEGKYLFNILSRRTLDIIYNSREDLNKLLNCGFKEANIYFNIYDLVIENLFNNQNLFLLTHKLLVYKLTNPKNARFNVSQLIKVQNINFKFMRGVGYMGNLEHDLVKKANRDGYFLRKEYKERKAENKLSGISYRLLNALKVNNKDMFMDTILNCYLYVQKTVPQIFLDGLTDDVAFKTIGYAFVSGLIEGKQVINKDENGGVINE